MAALIGRARQGEGVAVVCVREEVCLQPYPLFCVCVCDCCESYFVLKRSRMTQLPCWLTSSIVPLMTRSHHLPQSLIPSLLHSSFPIKLCPWILTAASAFCHNHVPSQKPHCLWGFSRYPWYSLVFPLLSFVTIVQRRNH